MCRRRFSLVGWMDGQRISYTVLWKNASVDCNSITSWTGYFNGGRLGVEWVVTFPTSTARPQYEPARTPIRANSSPLSARPSMTTKAKCLFVARLTGARPARCGIRPGHNDPNFGYYDNPATISAFVPVVDNKPMSVDHKGILATTLSALGTTSDLKFTTDTGSTGITISADKFNPDPGGENSEKGLHQAHQQRQNRKGVTSRPPPSRTARAEDGRCHGRSQSACRDVHVRQGHLHPAKDVSYFGVGYDRGGTGLAPRDNPPPFRTPIRS